MTDNAKAFKSEKVLTFCQGYGIELVHSITYYTQGNGFVESSNNNLVRIIKKMLDQNKQGWDSHLKFLILDERISTK